MASEMCAIGIDLGGSKIEVALVDRMGVVIKRRRLATDVVGGPEAIAGQIVGGVKELLEDEALSAIGVGVGVAGQIELNTGLVHFAPNLGWHEVQFQSMLSEALGFPSVITNDVRAATWGEWLFGAGKGCDDLICVFVGTGIGGGVVSGGRMISGCGNTAGELGHITVSLHGPDCTCGNQGCMEALAGGWAIARRARSAARGIPATAAVLLEMAGGRPEDISTQMVAEAYRRNDPLACRLLDEAAEALVAGAVTLVNAFNPRRLILGGGVIQGLPELVDRVDQGVRQRALRAATTPLEISISELGNEAGVIGAAALAMRFFSDDVEIG